MSGKRYKTTFESVGPYADGGRFYRGDDPVCAPADVPDEFWHTTEVEHDGDQSRMEQFETLRQWAATGEQLIRNVRLFEMPSGEWSEVTS